MVDLNSIQSSRAKAYLRSERSVSILVRYFCYCLAALALVTLILNLIISIPNYLNALAILSLMPGLLVGSYSMFLGYLWYFPEYLIPKKNRTIIDSYDLETLVFLHRWRKTGYDIDQIISSLSSSPLAAELFFRLGLVGPVDQEFVDEQTVFGLIERSQDQPDIFGLLFQLKNLPVYQGTLIDQNLTDKDCQLLFDYYRQKRARIRAEKLYWLDPNHHHQGGFADDWTVSYTNLLDSLSTEVTGRVHQHASRYPMYSRETLVDQAIKELEKRSGQNVLLVGPEGSGRTELFYHLASRLLNFETRSDLAGVGIRILQPQEIVALASSDQQLIALVDRLFREIARAKRVVVYIPEIDLLLNPSEKIGTIDITELLSSNLDDQDTHIVASISQEGYNFLIKSQPNLAQSFSVVRVPPPTPEDLIRIVLDEIGSIEVKNKVVFFYSAVIELVDQASRYLKESSSPKRELLLLEDIASFVRGKNERLVFRKDINDVLGQKTGVPIAVAELERKTLINLEDELNRRVIGQKNATKAISQAIVRSRAGLKEANRPLASFLFLGPTGVGKTETAKALSQIYFNTPDQLIHLDMTEYGSADGLVRLLGTDPINDPGSLTLKIQEKPSGIVLFDEIEKAHLYVKNLLLQVLDEGRLTTNYGKVLDFSNSIVIATSNAGSEFILTQIDAGRKAAEFEKGLIDYLFAKAIFSPELINRFDGTIVFTPLDRASVRLIVELRLNELRERLKADKGIVVNCSDDVFDALSEAGYDPVFGARALERTIKNKLETKIAQIIIEQDPRPGTSILIEKL